CVPWESLSTCLCPWRSQSVGRPSAAFSVPMRASSKQQFFALHIPKAAGDGGPNDRASRNFSRSAQVSRVGAGPPPSLRTLGGASRAVSAAPLALYGRRAGTLAQRRPEGFLRIAEPRPPKDVFSLKIWRFSRVPASGHRLRPQGQANIGFGRKRKVSNSLEPTDLQVHIVGCLENIPVCAVFCSQAPPGRTRSTRSWDLGSSRPRGATAGRRPWESRRPSSCYGGRRTTSCRSDYHCASSRWPPKEVKEMLPTTFGAWVQNWT
ncbi:unnamed protein product, partial [Prorocentrum cordatum]